MIENDKVGYVSKSYKIRANMFGSLIESKSNKDISRNF